MQQGGGDVQDRLATLAAMKQLMGNPMQDLGGLLGLQGAMQDMEQQRLNEERSSRQEDFAQSQLDQSELRRRQDYALAEFAAKQDAKDRGFNREQAARNYELGQRRAAVEERQAAATEERNKLTSEASQREAATGFSPDLHKLLNAAGVISASPMLPPGFGQSLFDALSAETGYDLGGFVSLRAALPGEGRPDPNAPEPGDTEGTVDYLKKGPPLNFDEDL